MSTQKNSFISLMEQISLLNKNSVEIITKVKDVVESKKSSIDVNYKENDGSISKYSLPTVGWLKKEIDIANSNINKLAGLSGDDSVTIIDTNGNSRKIKSVSLDREPEQISNLEIATNFKQSNNWFFEGLMNPLLSVEMDLSGKISEEVTKILSRRYIIKFEKDDKGNRTTSGQKSYETFEERFLNNNNFSIEDFTDWLNSPTNNGVLNIEDENLHVDEQLFDLNYKNINYKGYFSVLGIEKDTINNKNWYLINTLTYYDRKGNEGKLSIGDSIITTNKGSYTRYKILEIDTANSQFRLNLERVEGYDPVPIGTNVLEYYSSITTQSKVNVTIGFDEYNVIFLKSINTDNNIISSRWSKGMAFYTNDLLLETDSNVSMSDFYVDKVYDYGSLLKDMVEKKIPSKLGEIPNKPTPILDNFKVVQINKHLTDEKDNESLRNINLQKNSSKAKLNEINKAIQEKTRELNIKSFKSVAEKSKSQNELNKLIKQNESETKLYSTLVSQLYNNVVEKSATPKFRIRGFWDMPDPIWKVGSKNQEVIGFEIQYKYLSKNGSENTTEGFDLNKPSGFGTTQKRQAYYSQWNKHLTDIRKRTYDKTNGQWIWEIEDVSNADTPNINQLDIPIQKNEKVLIRMRSISEVGYPDTPLYSDWSDIMTIEFPDELNDILQENDFILQEATKEEARVSFESELQTKGVLPHVKDSFYVNEQYFSHLDKNIATSFKDSFGNTLSLYDYLKEMSNKISALEESISRAKGELKVTLFNGTKEIEILNGTETNVVINCEDYMVNSSDTTNYLQKSFVNSVYMIDDYKIRIENVANENELGLLTDKTTDIIDSQATFINDSGIIKQQSDNQYIWLLDNDGVNIYGENADLSSDLNLANDTTNLLNYDGWNNSAASKPFGATIHPRISKMSDLVDANNNNIHVIEAQKSKDFDLQIYFKPDIKNDVENVEILASSEVQVLNKTLKFRIDEEHSNRPFQFVIKFKLNRHNKFIQRLDSDIARFES